jgi:NAD-dependent dihydropyrimidine dehydrogenase PreA subunit
MKRNIITIDEDACNGCGQCVDACHEGALRLVNGKAKLVSESFCDGLGACLPKCPVDAIRIEEREADAFDPEAVAKKDKGAPPPSLACGCPGTMARKLNRPAAASAPVPASATPASASELRQWPVQIKLVPVNAPYFDQAKLLIAADCTAYAYARIHDRFMKGRITLIGCPKLDAADYAEKLTAILAQNDIKSVTVLRMEVPCCGGIVSAVQRALSACGKTIPWRAVTVTTDGELVEE